MANWVADDEPSHEIAYTPSRVLMQDFTGVPAIVDLAAMRDAMEELGGDATAINPLVPVELVIDHSIQVDSFAETPGLPEERRAGVRAQPRALRLPALGPDRVRQLLRGAAQHGHLPPGQPRVPGPRGHRPRRPGLPRHAGGHRLPHHDGQRPGRAGLGRRRHRGRGGDARPAGVHAAAPGRGLPAGGRAARGRHRHRPRAHRHRRCCASAGWWASSWSSSAPAWPTCRWPTAPRSATCRPEYGATCAIFPVDDETLRYLSSPAGPASRSSWWRPTRASRACSTTRTLEDADLLRHARAGPGERGAQPGRAQAPAGPGGALATRRRTSSPSCATRRDGQGRRPRRQRLAPRLPGERPAVVDGGRRTTRTTASPPTSTAAPPPRRSSARARTSSSTARSSTSRTAPWSSPRSPAAPTPPTRRSCSAPGCWPRRRVERGLTRKPWVKTSLAPGSKVVTDYLERAGLIEPLDELGFNLVGYGCTTCIGNSGPLPEDISAGIEEERPDRLLGALGQPQLRGADPPRGEDELPGLAAAVRGLRAGRPDGPRHLEDPLGQDADGQDVYLRDIWPTQEEVNAEIEYGRASRTCSARATARCSRATRTGTALEIPEGDRYAWDDESTYVKRPPYFEGMDAEAPEGFDEIERRPRHRPARRQRDHRPHLAGRARSRRTRRPAST